MKKIIEHILDDSGQSTVEFAIVTAAFLCFVIAIGLL